MRQQAEVVVIALATGIDVVDSTANNRVDEVIRASARAYADSFVKVESEKITFMNGATGKEYHPGNGSYSWGNGMKSPFDTREERKNYYENVWGRRLNEILKNDKGFLEQSAGAIEGALNNNYEAYLEKNDLLVPDVSKTALVLEQIVYGEFSDVNTIEGTGIQILMGLTGVDLPADIRDTVASIMKGDAQGAAINALGMLPLIGAIKKIDKAGELVEQGIKSRKAAKAAKGA